MSQLQQKYETALRRLWKAFTPSEAMQWDMADIFIPYTATMNLRFVVRQIVPSGDVGHAYRNRVLQQYWLCADGSG